MADRRALAILYRILTAKPLNRATLFLLQDAVKRFGHRMPRDILGGLDLFFFRDLIGNVERGGDGVDDSFRFTVTSAWYDQRITGIDLRVDGRRVPRDRIVFRYPGGETRARDVTSLEFAPGDAMEIIAEGFALADGLHLLDFTLDMELVGQIIPILPILMKNGTGDFAILDDAFSPYPDFPPASVRPGTVHFVPHIHYDVEWMKTRETFEKVGEANLREMLRLMEEDPEMTFVVDQVPQLEPFRRRDPGGFEKLVDLVRQGRIEPVNGMYSEPDVNLLSGESLVRQSVAWQRYSAETFGALSRCGWLIDSFGMSAQLPQIFALSGGEFFAFSRARPPEGSPSEFFWEGLDGTRILTHNMPRMYLVGHPMPTDRARALRKMLKNYLLLRDESMSDTVFMPAGVDHGRPQKAYGEMIRAWNSEVEEVSFEFSLPSRFFEALPRNDLRVLKGEFQRELWGANSGRIELKKSNRECEFALLDAEKLATVAALSGNRYPEQDLEGAWRAVMDNQFHDQIGGCSIDEVAAGMKARFGQALETTRDLMRSAASFISKPAGGEREGFTVLAFNPLSSPASSWTEFEVILPPGWTGLSVQSEGKREPLQVVDSTVYGDGSPRMVRVGFRPDIPPLGYRLFTLTPSEVGQPGVPDPVVARGHALDNGLLTVQIDSIKGLLSRAVLSDGTAFDLSGGNRLTLERDFGNLYEATAFGTTFMHPRRVSSVRVVEAGPLRGTIEVQGVVGRSPFTHRISLTAGSPRIDIETGIDFADRGCRLRCRFPTGIESGAWTHEIPYGCIQRPGHELPAQNFVDISTRGQGVTLINFGTPGNKFHRGTIYLTLLRSTDKIYQWDSGPDALELGGHVFRYALYPHRDGWREAGSLLEAYRRNNPPRAFVFPGTPAEGARASYGAIECRCPNACVSAFLSGGDGDVVVRLWETGGRACEAELAFGWEPAGVLKTDFLQRELEELPLESNLLKVPLGPFEIATLVVRN